MLELLETSYKIENDERNGCQLTREDYILSRIFDVHTYDDGDIATLLAKHACEVAAAITNRTTFEYIKDFTNYTHYIHICHWPFFQQRITWGSSIRGAWWNIGIDKMSLNTCGLYLPNGEQQTDWEFTQTEWDNLMLACGDFIKLK